MTDDTTTWGYWLHWWVLLCAFWVLSTMVVASVLIWKYEGSSIRDNRREETNQETMAYFYDESWRPCLKDIHPAWLLIFRVIAFFLMFSLLIINVVVDGGSVLYYYTQWTFMLVTIYFGLGSLLSTYGCYQYFNRFGSAKADSVGLDKERGTYAAPTHEEGVSIIRTSKRSACKEETDIYQRAGNLDCVFQIIYQTCGGAVMLTDFVFWFIIVPFTVKDYKLNFLIIAMHSINVVFLVGDTAFNSLRFPWFRISYFILWTAIYVLFQWIIHACVSIWWPYPFLELSSSWAVVWYLLVGLMHIPCYAVFGLIIKLKHLLFSRWFPHSYQC